MVISTSPPSLQAAANCGADANPRWGQVTLLWTRDKPGLKIGGGHIVFAPSYVDASADCASWDSIALRYALPWPMPLLLTPDAMARYQTMFSYLLAMQRAVLALQHVWLHLTTQCPAPSL